MTHIVIEARRLDILVDKIRAVPDKLVAMQIDLRPLCRQGSHDIPADAQRRLQGSYEALQSAISDVHTILDYVLQWEEADSQHPATDANGDGPWPRFTYPSSSDVRA